MDDTQIPVRSDDGQTLVTSGQLGMATPQTQPQVTQASQPVSVPNKEMGVSQSEKVPLVEMREEERIPEDVQAWVEKTQNEDIELPEPIMDGKQVLVAEPSVVFKEDRIVLPLTSKSYAQSMKKKVTESARWLAEWCGRLIKVLGERATFRN